MKKNYLKTVTGSLGCCLLLLITLLIIHSCRKSTQLTQQQINAEVAASNLPVKDAMAWFAGNKTVLSTKLKINSDEAFLNSIADFTPVWDSARTAVDTNYYVVEAPAKYVKKLGFNMDSSATNINGVTRLLILKSKKYGNLSAALMHVHGSAGVNISNVHYMDIPPNFSGNIFYTSLQGASIYGYIYKNGKITLVSAGKGSSKARTGPQILEVAPGECETITTDWYSQTCFYTGSDELIGCTDWTYVFSTEDTYCAPPAQGGGGMPPPPDCPPGDGSGSGGGGGVNVESVKNKLIVTVAAGGGGDGSGDCNTCQAQADAFFSENAPVADGTLSDVATTVDPTNPDNRSKIYNWVLAKSLGGYNYKINSIEKGVQTKVGTYWQWVSLEHTSLSVSGLTSGFTTVNLLAANPTIETYYSTMQIVYTVTLGFTCGGIPIYQTTDPLSGSKTFGAND